MSWRRFFRRAWWDDERTRELESYLELETDDNIARGMSPDEASAAARRKLGNTGRIREEIYAMNTITFIEWLGQDIRYAARVLRRNPGFTIAAVLTLALGIGGVTVIYSALRNILLDPFPYANPERMVNVYVTNAETGDRQHGGAMGQDEAVDFLEQQTPFETVVVSATDAGVMRTATGSDMVTVTEMTANTFPYLAVQPLKGRVFTDADTLPGAAPVVVLDYTTWIEKFGGRDDVLGQVITVGDTPRTIVGVMPDRFGWQDTSMWVPLALRRGATPPDERRFWYQASVKPGVTLAEASERMTAIVKRRALAHPDEYPPQVRIEVLDLRYRVVGRFSNVLFTLLGAVVLLLLIACCNVANMLLARATTREREMTLRCGTRRWQAAHHGPSAHRIRPARPGRRRRWLPAGMVGYPRSRGHPSASGHCRRSPAPARAGGADGQPRDGRAHHDDRRHRPGMERVETGPCQRHEGIGQGLGCEQPARLAATWVWSSRRWRSRWCSCSAQGC